VNEFRAEFPFFQRHPEITYLDSAATTQRPRQVIEAVAGEMAESGNPGRGEHRLAGRALRRVESVRERLAAFLGARGPHEIAFTSGATASLDLLARAWGAQRLSAGDVVALCPADHAAAVQPWTQLAESLPLEVRTFGVARTGSPSRRALVEACREARVLALTHVHNVFGERTDVASLRGLIGERTVISLDAAQSAGHLALDVGGLGVQALSFSAHKMFGPPGLGVLWIHERLLDELRRLPGGRVSSPTGLAARVEVGSLNVPAIAGLGSALELIDRYGIERLTARVHALTLRLVEGLEQIEGIEMLPGVAHTSCREGHGIVAVRLAGTDSADLGLLLDERGFAVRAGSHCRAGDDAIGDSVRFSLHAYTTEQEIDRCVEAVAEIAAA
jgi:cysteine desulfurase / selenocysteine lyase